MGRSASSKDASPNAFEMLMSQRKKRKTSGSSRFVLCPAGCGKHIADIEINAHLDMCIQTTGSSVSNSETVPLESTPNDPNHGNVAVDGEGAAAEVNSVTTPESMKAAPSSIDNVDDCKEKANAFAHMMKQSARVFTTVRLAQRFHLHEDGTVSLTCYPSFPGPIPEEVPPWSTSVQLKGRKPRPGTSEAENPPPTVELSVTSDIPSSPRRIRLVQRHTRLSIPVLKSILQKSMRRRKPLPAVRVAMELADKSLEDLIRRIPIITLEDSSLHPSFALLVWLMIAQSKGFEPDQLLMTKIISSVYEMASCPWKDRLDDDDVENGSLSLSSFHQDEAYTLSSNETTIWSMFARANYGGMGGDIRMLHMYAHVWNHRFANNVPEVVKERLASSTLDGESLRWTEIPTVLHQTGIAQSASRVGPMCKQGIPCLVFANITTEGVDFHCSSVLEHLLSDREFAEQAMEPLGNVAEDIGLDPIPSVGNEKRRLWLERALKRCIWTYSAGVNRRLSLTRIGDGASQEADKAQEVWKALLAPKVRAFAEKYVKERM